ncbi:mechanosensitive ion channel [bacterium]|nr:mechanosensitive ion channel [bacterium]
MEKFLEYIKGQGAEFGLNLLAAAAVFVIGRYVAKFLRGLVNKLMTKAKVDPTLISFSANLTYAALLVFVIIAALGQLGVQTTSFIAVLGAAGLAVGLALQGSLANFASGVLMIMFRPIKVGDFVEASGVAGKVADIDILTTTLTTADNKTVILPNSSVMGNNIINYTRQGTRRVDMVMGVSYSDDLDKVRTVIQDVLSKDERILEDPELLIAVCELGDSSVNFVVRPWVNADDYWGVKFDTLEALKKRFDAEGISIPFPQRDVHLHKTDAE